MSDTDEVAALKQELLAAQGAIEELSIGVWPEGWPGYAVAVFNGWPTGFREDGEVEMVPEVKEIALRPQEIRGLFEMVLQKIGGMRTFAQRTYRRESAEYMAWIEVKGRHVDAEGDCQCCGEPMPCRDRQLAEARLDRS